MRERECVCVVVCVYALMRERECIYIDMVVSISGQTDNMRVNRRFHMYGTYIGFHAFQKNNASYAAVTRQLCMWTNLENGSCYMPLRIALCVREREREKERERDCVCV